jgi:hypothetical protein
MRMFLFVLTGPVLIGFYVLGRAIVHSKYGRVLQAIRDAETRVMFTGYDPLAYKLSIWTLSAVMCGIAGGALRAAGRHHQSERDDARGEHRDRDLGSRRRSRDADRPDRRAPSSSTAPRAGSRRRSPSSGCTSSARCSSP